MKKRRRIVIYGNSLIMGALRASLLRSRNYKVISVTPAQQERLERLAPDVVLFDLDVPRPEAAFSLLARCHGLMLIGVRADDTLVKIWSGRLLRELSTRELMEAMDRPVDLGFAAETSFIGIVNR